MGGPGALVRRRPRLTTLSVLSALLTMPRSAASGCWTARFLTQWKPSPCPSILTTFTFTPRPGDQMMTARLWTDPGNLQAGHFNRESTEVEMGKVRYLCGRAVTVAGIKTTATVTATPPPSTLSRCPAPRRGGRYPGTASPAPPP